MENYDNGQITIYRKMFSFAFKKKWNLEKSIRIHIKQSFLQYSLLWLKESSEDGNLVLDSLHILKVHLRKKKMTKKTVVLKIYSVNKPE